MTAVSLRRRLDDRLLRWYARLDGERADQTLPWLIATVVFLVLLVFSLARHRTLDSGAGLATYTQGAWLIAEGIGGSLTIPAAQIGELNGSLLFYPLAFIIQFLPISITLLVVQSMALAAGVVPLWRICRRLVHLRVGATAAVIAGYGLFPAVHNLNTADFHPGALAVPVLFGACFYGLSGSSFRYLGCIIGAVGMRADLSLTVAGLGILLIVTGRRRMGTFSLLAGLTWFILAGTVDGLGAGAGGPVYPGAFEEFGGSPFSVLGRLFTAPGDVLKPILSERSFEILVYLLAPLAFLPLVGFRYLVPGLPLWLLYLVGDVPSEILRTELTVGVMPFLFLGTAYAVSRIGELSVERVSVSPRVVGALLLAAVVFFVRDSTTSPYREPWHWGSRDLPDLARLEAMKVVPAQAAVRAASTFLPRMAERERLYLLVNADEPDPTSATADNVDVVMVDRNIVDWNLEQWTNFQEGLTFFGFQETYTDHDVHVFIRP